MFLNGTRLSRARKKPHSTKTKRRRRGRREWGQEGKKNLFIFYIIKWPKKI